MRERENNMSNPITMVAKAVIIGGVAYGSFKLGEKMASVKRASDLKEETMNRLSGLVGKCSATASDIIAAASEAIIEKCTAGEGDDSAATSDEVDVLSECDSASNVIYDSGLQSFSVAFVRADGSDGGVSENVTNDSSDRQVDSIGEGSVKEAVVQHCAGADTKSPFQPEATKKNSMSISKQLSTAGKALLSRAEKSVRGHASDIVSSGSLDLDQVRNTVMQKIAEVSEKLQERE